MDILKYPNPILKQKTELVTEFGPELHRSLVSMKLAMLEHKGIGLAANQVGINQRFFIMQDKKGQLWEFINPEITDREDTILINEGCLSAPDIFVQIARSKTVTVQAKDRNGEDFTVICQDIEAVCVQHEIDHLDGIFYLDKAPRQQRRAAYSKLGIK